MRQILSATTFCTVALVVTQIARAHCEVPCGIYADEQRFKAMLENTDTIAKAQQSVEQLLGDKTAQSMNQVVRWLNTKEDHATDTQHIIAQYFMTQRIKAGQPDYTKRLTSAHAVMVEAMKCKQSADPATADALRTAILDFYRAYEGKEPQLTRHAEPKGKPVPQVSSTPRIQNRRVAAR